MATIKGFMSRVLLALRMKLNFRRESHIDMGSNEAVSILLAKSWKVFTKCSQNDARERERERREKRKSR